MQPPFLNRRDFFKLIGGALGFGALSYYLGLRSQPQPTPSENLPAYLDLESGFPVFRGPYLQKDAQLTAFLIPAELIALSALCDQTLNAVPDAAFRYIPLLSNLLLVQAEMLVSSLDERDAQVGLIPETEVSFWLLTIAMQETGLGLVPHHLAWHIPYLLVDEANAIASGREVYGFNKQSADFEKATDAQSLRWSANVLGFERFGPDAIARKERLLEITSPAHEASASQWPDWRTAQGDLSKRLRSEMGSDLDDGLLAFAAQTALENIPLVFLKQFRDARQPRKACYQALVEAPLQIQAFRGGGFFEQAGELSLHPLESHPLAQRLGLKEKQTSSWGVWLKVDFTLGVGVE
ncbi:MAG: hypothetical protein RBS68_00335 [Anaerolineales bacterium]|jgi:hypothetical protein|nr:hypothetical protein [Anaerolineales bacterium]